MGVAVVVTLKLSEVPVEKSTESADVMTGAWSTVKVKDWLAFGLTPLLALMVSGIGAPGGRRSRPGWPCRCRCRRRSRPTAARRSRRATAVGNPAVVTVNDPGGPVGEGRARYPT